MSIKQLTSLLLAGTVKEWSHSLGELQQALARVESSDEEEDEERRTDERSGKGAVEVPQSVAPSMQQADRVGIQAPGSGAGKLGEIQEEGLADGDDGEDRGVQVGSDSRACFVPQMLELP